MIKISTISKAAAAAVLGSVILAGCGSSSSSTTNDTTSNSVLGKAIDGYLEGSTVAYNGVIQDSSGEDGAITFTNEETNASVVQTVTVSGGLDQEGDGITPFAIPLKAIFSGTGAQTVNVTPLTTLVAALMDKNSSYGESNASAAVAQGLGITEAQLKGDFTSNSDLKKKVVSIVKAVETTQSAMGLTDAQVSTMFANIATDIIQDSNSTNEANLTKALTTDLDDPTAGYNTARILNKNLTLSGGGTTWDDVKAKIGFILETLAEVQGTFDKYAALALNKVFKNVLSETTNGTVDIDNNITAFADSYKKIEAAAGDKVIDWSIVFQENNSTVLSQLVSDANSTGYDAFFIEEDDLAKKQIQALLDSSEAIDNITAKNNAITIGDTTVSFTNGKLDAVVSNEPVPASEISSLYNVEFTLDDVVNTFSFGDYKDTNASYSNLENGDEHNITLGLEIVDTANDDKLFVALDGLKLGRDGTHTAINYLNDVNATGKTNYTGDYTLSLSGGKIYGQVNTTSSSVDNDTNAIALSNGKFSLNLETIITKLEGDATLASKVAEIKEKFSQTGNYSVNLYLASPTITGLSSAKQVSAPTNTGGATFTGNIFNIAGSVAIAANDKLAFASDQVTLGSGDEAKTITISNGAFTASHKPVESANLGDIYNVAFSLANIMDGTAVSSASVEDGDVHNLALTLKIEDKESSRMISATMTDLVLERSATSPDTNTSDYNGEYTITAGAGSQIIGAATKSDGTPLSSTMTNSSVQSYITTNNGQVNVNLESLITEFESSLGQTALDLKAYFSDEGKYTVTMDLVSETISGVQNATSSATNTYSIVGDVTISNNEAPVFTSTNDDIASLALGATQTITASATDAENAGTITYALSSNDESVTVNGMAITAAAKGNATITITATDADDISSTTTFTVTVPNTAPVLPTLTNQTLVEDTAITDINVTATDADSDTITYSVSTLPTGVTLVNNVITGTPTSAGTYNIEVNATDGTATDTETFSLAVTADPDAPTWNEIVNEHDLSVDYNDHQVTAALVGTLSASTISINTTLATIPTGTSLDTSNMVTLLLVETAGGADYIEFKYKTTSYSDGDKFNITVGSKECEVTVGQTYTDDEIVLN